MKEWNKVFVLPKKCNSQIIKEAAANGRFGASGGVSRPTLCVEQPLPLSSKSL